MNHSSAKLFIPPTFPLSSFFPFLSLTELFLARPSAPLDSPPQAFGIADPFKNLPRDSTMPQKVHETRERPLSEQKVPKKYETKQSRMSKKHKRRSQNMQTPTISAETMLRRSLRLPRQNAALSPTQHADIKPVPDCPHHKHQDDNLDYPCHKH